MPNFIAFSSTPAVVAVFPHALMWCLRPTFIAQLPPGKTAQGRALAQRLQLFAGLPGPQSVDIPSAGRQLKDMIAIERMDRPSAICYANRHAAHSL
jgi:hypothetical protein